MSDKLYYHAYTSNHLPSFAGKKTNKEARAKESKFIFSGSGVTKLIMPEMASHKCFNGKYTNGTNLWDNHYWSRYFGDLWLAASPCGHTYRVAVAYANTVHAHSKRNAMWPPTTFGFGSARYISQWQSLNNVFSWGRGKHVPIFFSSLPNRHTISCRVIKLLYPGSIKRL